MDRIRIAALLLAAACPGIAAGSDASDLARLQQHDWQLSHAVDSHGKRLDVLFVTGDPPPTLEFHPHHVGLRNLCNSMGGRFTLKDSQLTVASVEQTLMGCMGPKGEQELETKRRILGTTTLVMGGAGPLTLHTTRGDTLVFEPVPHLER